MLLAVMAAVSAQLWVALAYKLCVGTHAPARARHASLAVSHGADEHGVRARNRGLGFRFFCLWSRGCLCIALLGSREIVKRVWIVVFEPLEPVGIGPSVKLRGHVSAILGDQMLFGFRFWV